MSFKKYNAFGYRDKLALVLDRLDAAKTAIENMSAGGPIEYAIDANGKVSKGNVVFKLPSNFKDLDSYAFYYAMSRNNNLISADLSSLTTISGSSGAVNMLEYCTKLTSVDLSSLTTISGYSGAQYLCRYCSKLTSVDLSSLATISGGYALSSAFQGCTSLRELRFPALTADSFGTNKNQLNSMLSGVTNCTLHFPAAAQAKIETLTGYPNFGGTSTVVLFDL